MRSYNFKFFWVIQTLIVGVFLYVSAIYKNVGSEYISNDKLLTLIGSLGQVCNACGRISINYLLERLGFKRILIIINVLACI